MDTFDSFSAIPFAEHIGIGVTHAEDGVADLRFATVSKHSFDGS
jgi:hypothetical protein